MEKPAVSMMRFLLQFAIAVPAIAADRVEYFYVTDAALREIAAVELDKARRDEQSLARLLHRHEIENGDKVVLAIRRYEAFPGMIDANTFTKISIELPALETCPVEFDLAQLKGAFSTGGSSWASKGGTATSALRGRLTLLKCDGAWDVQLHLSADADNSVSLRTVHVTFDERFIASKLAHDQLTFWLGKPFRFHEWRKAASP
jgi:hypothetical protein